MSPFSCQLSYLYAWPKFICSPHSFGLWPSFLLFNLRRSYCEMVMEFIKSFSPNRHNLIPISSL